MELRRYLLILRRRTALIVLTMIATTMAAYFITPRTPQYVAESTIYVGNRELSGGAEGNQISNDRLSGLERLAFTFAAMIDSEPIASDAVELAGIERSSAAVVAQTTATLLPGTQLVKVTVTDPVPAVAQALSDGLANALVTKVQEFEPTVPAGEGDVPSLPAYVFSRARLPVQPQPTGLAANLVRGMLFGLFASVTVTFLLDYLDITIRSADDVERRLELPVLGVLPLRRAEGPRSDVLRRPHSGAVSELA